MSITNLQQARQMYAMGQRVGRIAFGGGGSYSSKSSGYQGGSGAPGSAEAGKSSYSSPSDHGGTGNDPGGYVSKTNPTGTLSGDDYKSAARDFVQTLNNNNAIRANQLGTKFTPYQGGSKNKPKSGLGSLLMSGLGMLMGIPGLGLLTGGLKNLGGGIRNLGGGIIDINNKIQNSNFGKSKNLMDYLDMKKYGGFDERELARAKTMQDSRDLQARIDAGEFDGFEKPTQTFSFDNSGMQSTNLNNIESIVAASQVPQGITYYNNDQQPQQQGIMGYPSDLATEFQDMATYAGNYAQNEVGNQLYGKEYDVLNPFEQQQIDTAIETYGTKSDGKLASGTSYSDI